MNLRRYVFAVSLIALLTLAGCNSGNGVLTAGGVSTSPAGGDSVRSEIAEDLLGAWESVGAPLILPGYSTEYRRIEFSRTGLAILERPSSPGTPLVADYTVLEDNRVYIGVAGLVDVGTFRYSVAGDTLTLEYMSGTTAVEFRRVR